MLRRVDNKKQEKRHKGYKGTNKWKDADKRKSKKHDQNREQKKIREKKAASCVSVHTV